MTEEKKEEVKPGFDIEGLYPDEWARRMKDEVSALSADTYRDHENLETLRGRVINLDTKLAGLALAALLAVTFVAGAAWILRMQGRC